MKNLLYFLVLITCSCSSAKQNKNLQEQAIKPVIVTDTVYKDSDDPAIWINYNNLSESLILGTDKANEKGGVYAFGLDGRIIKNKTTINLKRINNIDVAYGLDINGTLTDIAVATERGRNQIRVFSLPAMDLIDDGGIPIFEDSKEKDPMGIALYKNAATKKIYAIVGRKTGPAEGYLYQYLLEAKTDNKIRATLVRKFGKYSGKKEIESIAVDNELGYVYYSDEQVGIRKYYADPEKGNEELALFGTGEFKEDNEGISVYKFDDGTGYILVSDQGADRFNIYPREGTVTNKHAHNRIASVPVSTSVSDGSDITAVSLPGFAGGLFVAMSTDKTFHYYRWMDIAKRAKLKVRN